ncbi:hypothetical protein Pmani_021572 [Petrolisthes manimaculis]|uniref:Large ribosomal subunit protein uL23m n=1 Tax=Petrolisthes manimaculis TaxID=1843537 RepID=A0AAE1U312_9EUCA|nr:hypothetical protein Pmani_021572 [Petrolisthes manimaculis]
MSTRFYPRYYLGNPQLRVFLPNFVMKLIKPPNPQPPNVVTFIVSTQMTKFDIQNYLEKIYKVPVASINTHIHMGEIKRSKVGGYLIKDDDYKIAYVTMPKTETFEFPDLYPSEKEEKMEKEMEQIKLLQKDWSKKIQQHKHRPGMPSWFGA